MSNATESYTIVPLRDVVIFPHSVAPLFVGREKSIQSLREAVEKESGVVLVTQKKAEVEAPGKDDLYTTGTLVRIVQIINLPDGTVKALVEGKSRVLLQKCLQEEPTLVFAGTPQMTHLESEDNLKTVHRLFFKEFTRYTKLSKKKFGHPASFFEKMPNTEEMIDRISAHLPLELETKQKLLAEENLEARFELLLTSISKEIMMLEVEKKLVDRIQETVVEQQKEYVKRIKSQAIREEFGDQDMDDLEVRLSSKEFPDEVRVKVQSEIRKLKSMSPPSAEAGLIRNYLECLAELPWNQYSPLIKDLDYAESVLEKAHHGLDNIKKKVLEFIAVQNRMGDAKGSVLCFMGPPGVGKTSLAEAIAEATNRKFVRIALGGVRDEAHIRGHRRTYVGSTHGQIIQAMKKAQSCNPLILLDEIDKIGYSGAHGDPSSALLELLDPVQNKEFEDHYLGIPYDFSQVLFICTANVSHEILPALKDRMKFINISSYIDSEKMEIAKKHLIPQQKEKNGLKDDEFQITDSALKELVGRYTREAGVRNLDREIESLARQAVYLIERSKNKENPLKNLHITLNNLKKYAGVPRYQYGQAQLSENRPGLVYGLAYTETGGDLLPIEVVIMPKISNNNSQLTITGNLGQIMQESARIAISLARANAFPWGIDPLKFENDLHIHVPEGAVPKEGPSAGIALFSAVMSAFLNIPIRAKVAMTGEVTLLGKVKAIGGLKEKLLAAHRGHITTVLVPKENEKDLVNVPKNVKNDLNIVLVSEVQEVLEYVLSKSLQSHSLNSLMEKISLETEPTLSHF
jgi:ATP-dependent Lon protease